MGLGLYRGVHDFWNAVAGGALTGSVVGGSYGPSVIIEFHDSLPHLCLHNIFCFINRSYM